MMGVRPIPHVTLGDRLRRLRRTYGLDQREFAESIELSKSLVAKVELADVDPARPRMLLLSVEKHYGPAVAHWLETGCENSACPHSGSNREPTDYKVVTCGPRFAMHLKVA